MATSVDRSLRTRPFGAVFLATRWMGWVLASLLWALSCGSAFGATLDADVQKGVNWLLGQVQSSGALLSESSSVALPMQARAESITTLHTLSQSLPATLLSAIAAVTPDTTEYLAHKALTKQAAGSGDSTILDALVALQNSDGGFGAIAGMPSNPQDTAWAVHALAASRSTTSAAINALKWLLSAQQSDGAWALVPDGDTVVITALVVQSLAPYRQQSSVQVALSKARSWLTAQRNASQTWSDAVHTAHALLAVLPGLSTADTLQAAVADLRQAQLANGSWANDPYITALALRALWLATQPTTNPDLVSVSGQVVDENGQPIAGAVVQLTRNGVQAVTDADGYFGWSQLTAGADQLDIQATGYRSLTTPLSLQAGQSLDLGVIRLSLAGSGASSVTLQGTARYFTGTTYYAASNATIQVGTQTVHTDSTGNYRLDGLAAGTLEVVATYSSYPVVRATISAVNGQIIGFNPVFQKPQLTSSTLTVIVSDDAGVPLSSVTAALQNPVASKTVSTNTQGQALFTANMVTGTNLLTLTKSGYETVQLQFEVMVGQNLQLAVTLHKVTGSQTVLKGVVTDANTQQPLAGVMVRVAGTAFQTLTNALGEYTLSGDALNGSSRTVIFEKTGYLAHQQTFAIGAGKTTVFNVPLNSEPATGPAQLAVNVLVRGANAPLSGATVTLTGANQRAVQTDAQGNAVLENLTPGTTQIQVSAPGYEAAIASVDIQSGQHYVLPIELLATSAVQHKLYGQIIDAVSQAPITGAQVVLTGANSGTVTTAANGAYEFDDLALGEVQISVSRSGYVSFQQSMTLTGTTEATIPLTPVWQVGNTTLWEVFGTVVDADTLEPLVGAQMYLEEVLPGSAVTGTQTGVTELGGHFLFSDLSEMNARIYITLNGYDATLLPFTWQGNTSQSLGTIKMKRSYNAALPDLTISQGDRSGLVMDPNTFRATGTLSAVVNNNSNYSTGSFNALAFLDVNGNQAWDEGVDTLLDQVRVASLQPLQSEMVSFTLSDTKLPFRDAPVYVMADSDLEVIENIEGNNTLRVGVSCAGNNGNVQDVGVCIDTSGSVAHLYNLEMDGVIKAVENPNIIPQDGSIRFSLGTDYEMYYGNGIPLHQAQIITPAILPQLIQDLKTKKKTGGYSSGPTCVRRMSEYLASLPNPSNSRTVITVGDGYWEGIPKALTELPKTVANGVSRVDVIGIGAVNLPELEANAWPKPPNSLHGGQVTVAYSSGEVAAAMAQTLGAAAQTVDLTLGNFRILDQGAGNPLKLTARVGNAASPSQASTVRFYQGTVLLGEAEVPALKTGEWVDVSIEATLSGSDSLVAVVDEARTNAECNLSNNRQQIDLVAENALALLQVQTDKTIYGANAPVTLSALATNQGSFAAAFDLVLTIEDSEGVEVATFGSQALGVLAVGASQDASQPWNTRSTLAGSYVLRGRLFDTAGNVVAQDSAPFAIVAGDPSAAIVASLTVSTDKGDYTPNDTVLLANIAANLASNALINAARVTLTVRDPSGATVFTYEHTVGQMGPQSVRDLLAPQSLLNAALGTYSVDAVLYGRGPGLKNFGVKADPELKLAQASTTFRVLASGQRGTAEGLAGHVGVAYDSVVAGGAQSRDDLVHNTSSVDYSALKVIRVIAATSDGREVQRSDQVISLVAGEQHTWSRTPVSTKSLLKGMYSVLLLAEVNGQLVVLDQTTFTVTTNGAADPPVSYGAHTIPLASPAALALLSLSVALLGGRTRKRRSSRKSTASHTRSASSEEKAP